MITQSVDPLSSTLANKIDLVDLDCIKVKLMDSEEGLGWSRDRADAVEIRYRQFLFLAGASSQTVIPTKEIDAFWHQHILDTEKYAEDCDCVFGRMLHHFPYLGMRGEEDAVALQDAFERTREAYRGIFNGEYGDAPQRCEAGRCGPKCGQPHCRTKRGLAERPTLEPSSKSRTRTNWRDAS